ncbi:MAG: serine/threonine protein kinase [Moorea sp. SIO1F2]|nr:serine/threonine protein kinase [Moorena sp. SIO3I8]NEO20103.1 serine/threonine protein kinase [Moorena sp. SIO4A5]NEQ57222.1 serine/threonine protein kinase [Moorena sp. SIO4A1]NET84029.1 serine/threonine protein kinase [Moorena sp. SIO1F2]
MLPSLAKTFDTGKILGGRYRILRELGHGGFGRTYLAQDLNRFNELCVLKEFAPQVQGNHALQKAEELFEREAGVLYRLQHPQIPQFRELFQVQQQDKGTLLLVQDYVEGQTYRALLEARRPQGLRFSEAEVTQLLIQILPVLEYIHFMRVIHRDISPDNLILRSTDGLPVLIDFGGVKEVAANVASKFLGSKVAGQNKPIITRLGKVGYAPPEQMQGGSVFPHSDLYALGATILVLVTGQEPQQIIDPNTLTWNWRREISLSSTLGRILDKMLQPRPGERYQNAKEVLRDLTTHLQFASDPQSAPSPPQTKPTLAVAPGSKPVAVNQPATPATRTPLSTFTNNTVLDWLGKVVLVSVLAAAVFGFTFWATNWWFKFRGSQPEPSPKESPIDQPDIKPPSWFPSNEAKRKELLDQRRANLEIDEKFYVQLVNEAFWNKYPNQEKRQLGTGSKDAPLREEWDKLAFELLTRIELLNLSRTARGRLGSYGTADLTSWKQQVNQLRLSSRAAYDIADSKFFHKFPDQRGEKFIDKSIGQVWQGIVGDTIEALKSGKALQRIEFAPGAVIQQVSGTLEPGDGKAFTAKLSGGQVMEVRLATDVNALFSVYGPSRKTTLLEDSNERYWIGDLPASGFYEFVVVSQASEPINYRLNLRVED